MQLGPAQPETTVQQPETATEAALGDPSVNGQTESWESQDPEYASETDDSASQSVFRSIMPEDSSNMTTSLMFIGGILLAFIVLMRATRKKSAIRTAQTRSMDNPSERLSELHRQATASMQPVQRALVELEETARRFAAIMDNKSSMLEQLIEDADDRISTLRDLGEPTAEREAQIEQIRDHDHRPITRGVTPEDLDRARIEEDRAERASLLDEHAPPPFTMPKRDETPAPPPTERVMTTQDMVNDLADQGYDAQQIAEKLGKHVGHIELMLNIRRNSG